jgi:hypothetical protein
VVDPSRRDKLQEELRDELADLPAVDRDELISLAAHLAENRPLPRPALRSAIRQGLSLADSARPVRLRTAFAYLISGGALLLVAAVGLAGLGPFAA